MIEHIARYPRLRDRAVFVGDPDDIVDDRFGPDLPLIRDWTEAHYDFAGYVTGFDPARVRRPRGAARRARLPARTSGSAWSPSAAPASAAHLLRRVVDAFPDGGPAGARAADGRRHRAAHRPGRRCRRAAGPGGARLRPGPAPAPRRLRPRDRPGRPDDLHGADRRRPAVHLRPAAAPLRAELPRRAPAAAATAPAAASTTTTSRPTSLADAIAAEIGREVAYRPVATDGAARAAALLADLL